MYFETIVIVSLLYLYNFSKFTLYNSEANEKTNNNIWTVKTKFYCKTHL